MYRDWRNLSFEQKKLIICIAQVVVIAFLLIIYFGLAAIYEKKCNIASLPVVAKMNYTNALTDGNFENAQYTRVMVGTFIDFIDGFSIKDASFNITFYIWYNWNGDKKLNPGSSLKIIDGEITQKTLMEDYHDDKGYNYQYYKVSAKITKFFETFLIPVDEHVLHICIEDGVRDISQIRYTPDNYSNISPRVNIPGYKIAGTNHMVKNHIYNVSMDNPRDLIGNSICSQYIYNIKINRTDSGIYFKLFLPLVAALLLAFVSFFIKASELGLRFTLTTGAYFGVVANNYVVHSLLPVAGTFGLIDIMTSIGLFTIFLTIVLSLYSNYLFVYKKATMMSVVFDKAMLLALGCSCVMANIIIPVYAKSF